jgi:hypothetical protein
VSERKIPVWEKWVVGGLVAACAAGWGAVAWIQHKAKDPVDVVRKHFVFYPEYRGGTWSEAACVEGDRAGCKQVTYSVPVTGCGVVRFEWNVYADGDADLAYAYRGATPKLDEGAYALYAMVGEDSKFMDSPAVGKTAPASCALK